MLKQLLFSFVFAMTAATSHAAGGTLPAQTSNEQGVKVMVAPVNLAREAQAWTFEVTMETHVRDLGDDMTRASVLVADGKRYAPLQWTGAPPGSHHRKGNLRFAPVTPYPASLEVQILLQGEAAPRVFRWTLKGSSHAE